ncbi:MAG: redoxin domain-containing protein [Anaerohalosphaeraceae bacterium]
MKTKTLWIVGLLSVGLLLTAQSFADTCGDKKDKDNKSAFMTDTQAFSTSSADNNADCDKKKGDTPACDGKKKESNKAAANLTNSQDQDPACGGEKKGCSDKPAADRTAGGSSFVAAADTDTTPDKADKKDPNAAPMFTLNSQDGKEVKLADYKGKIVVLEWFNYDCPFVQAHYKAETFKKLADKYAKQKVVWFAVNSTHYATAKANQDFVAQHKLPYAILLDADGKTGKAYGAKTTPHVYVIDAKGRIVYHGAADNAPLGKTPANQTYTNYVEKAIDELLAGKPVTTPMVKPYGCSVKYPPTPAEK